LDGKAVSKMFSTHPPIEERIATLRAMESLGN
jgi:heat shock protein HtpX